MDINMPEMGGIEATRQIVAELPETVVILCSTYGVNDLPPDAATSGARAYVHKEQLDGQDDSSSLGRAKRSASEDGLPAVQPAAPILGSWCRVPTSDSQRTAPPMAPRRSIMLT
jgi:chemotaxis response regulator CheB